MHFNFNITLPDCCIDFGREQRESGHGGRGAEGLHCTIELASETNALKHPLLPAMRWRVATKRGNLAEVLLDGVQWLFAAPAQAGRRRHGFAEPKEPLVVPPSIDHTRPGSG